MAGLNFESSVDNVTEGPEFPAEGTLKAGGWIDSFEKKAPQFVKDAAGGIEAAARMPWNVIGGTVARGVGTLTGLGMGEGLDLASQRGEQAAERVSIPALTKSGEVADEALGAGYDYVKRDVVAEAMLALDRHEWNALKIPKDEQNRLEASRRSLYEGGFDMAMFGGMIKSGISYPRAIRKAREDALAKEAADRKANEKPFDTTKYNQTDLDFPQEGSLIPPGTRSPYNLDPKRKAELEAELNPPVEQQVRGQGELFRQGVETPYPEAFPGEGRVSPLEPSARERAVAGREDVLDVPDVSNQRIRPAGELEPPPMQVGGQEGARPLTFEERAPVNPGMGDTNLGALRDAARAEGRDLSRPIPYEPTVGPHQLPVKGGRLGGPESGAIGRPEFSTALENEVKYKQSTAEEGTTFSRREVLKELLQDMDEKDLSAYQFRKELQSYGIREGIFKPITKAQLDSTTSAGRGKKYDFKRGNTYYVFDSWESTPKGPGRSQAGGVTVPFGKAAERLGEKLQERANALRASIQSLEQKISKGTLEYTPALRKRFTELQQEFDATQAKQRAAGDVSYKEKHPGYKGLGSEKTAWDENGNLRPKGDVLPFKGPGSKQRGALGTLEKDIAKKGVVPTIQSSKKFWLEDTNRGLGQALKEDHPDLKAADVVDVAPAGSSAAKRFGQIIQKAASNFLIDKQLSIMSQGKGAISTAIKWVVDNQSSINRQLKMRIDENTNAALKQWRQLHKTSPKDLREMLTVWTENIGKEHLTETSFKNEKQFRTYEAVNKILTDGLRRTNEARAKAVGADGKPMKPIDYTENYFPSMRKGDWWIYVHDAGGVLKGAFAFETTGAANKAFDVLKKDMGAEFDVRSPALKKLTEKDLSSFDAYRETLKALHEGDPIATAIQKRYAYLAGHRGFARTGIYRKGIPGALGFEEGKLGVKNAEKVIESYINRQETYIANLDRAQLLKQVAEQVHLFKEAPIAEKYMSEYLNRSKGADLDMMPFIRKGVDALSTDVFGASRGVVPKFIQKTSSLASLFYLATVRNVVVNMTQSLNTFAKLVDLSGLDKKVHNPINAIFEGLVEAFNPDALSKEGRAWAKKHGSMESAIVNIIEGKLADFKSEGMKLVGEALRYGLGKVEQGAVRIPAFHMFEKALREAVPDKLERFEMASNLMDNYMVHYDRESSPLVYDKLGSVAGEATRGLKTYSHNYYGQFFEYLQQAKDHGRVAPLAAFLGTGTLIGGLRGLIMVAEATAIINLLNAIPGLDLDIPTPEQLMLKHGVNDTLLFGGASTILDKDISASVSAPGLPQLFSAVPVSFSWDIASAVFPYVVKRIGGTATEADEMAALMALSPKAMTGWVEYLYSQDGMIPDPNHQMAAKFPAPTDGREQLERFGLNFKTLDEAKFNMINRAAKQLIAHDIMQRRGALEAIADRVATGKEITPELMQKYIQEGGSMSTLMSGIKQTLINRQLDPQQRMMQGKAITPEKAHKLDRMKEVMDEELRQRMDERARGGFTKQSAELTAEERTGNLTAQDQGAMGADTMLKQEGKRRFPKSPVKAKIWYENALMREQEEAAKFDKSKNRMLDFNMQRDRQQARI